MNDIHTHIAPYVDDGADDTAEALEMLKKAAANGTERIALTPHFPSQTFGAERPAREYIEFLEQTVELLGEASGVELFVGAENYCGSDILERLEVGEVIPYAKTDYILLEFPYGCGFSYMRGVLDAFFDKGYRPVIAHAERYKCLQYAPERLVVLKEMGCKIQINADTVTARGGVEAQLCRTILQNGIADVVASDSHNVFGRSPDMSDANAEVCCICSPEYADELFDINPLKILRNEEF